MQGVANELGKFHQCLMLGGPFVFLVKFKNVSMEITITMKTFNNLCIWEYSAAILVATKRTSHNIIAISHFFD